MNRNFLLGLALVLLTTSVPAQTAPPAPAPPGPVPAAFPFEKEVFTDPRDPNYTITLLTPTECEYGSTDGKLTGTYTRSAEHLTVTLNDGGKPRVLEFAVATVIRSEPDHREFVSADMLAGLRGLLVSRAADTSRLQQAHTIALLLFQYAIDNDSSYPPGKSSTEVFQKLIDGKYVTDPAVFYFPMTGKVKPTSTTLKPENVCWDFTSPLNSDSSDMTPLVFTTGYKITYEASAAAKPLVKPASGPGELFVVAYKNNSIQAMHPGADGQVAGVISEAFTDSKSKTYTQLTPDGPVTP